MIQYNQFILCGTIFRPWVFCVNLQLGNKYNNSCGSNIEKNFFFMLTIHVPEDDELAEIQTKRPPPVRKRPFQFDKKLRFNVKLAKPIAKRVWIDERLHMLSL